MTDAQTAMRLEAIKNTAGTLHGDGYHHVLGTPTEAALDVRFLLAFIEAKESTKRLRTIADHRECEMWLMEHTDVLRDMKDGRYASAAWSIWQKAYLRGNWDVGKEA